MVVMIELKPLVADITGKVNGRFLMFVFYLLSRAVNKIRGKEPEEM